MTPALIRAEATQAGLPSTLSFPTVSVAGKTIDTGSKARAFASYMRIHALEASGGLTYSQLPRYATKDSKGTNDPAKALQVNGRPVDNPVRNVWVTETALSTALNTTGWTLARTETASPLVAERAPKSAVPVPTA
jgi:hypothetical protein